MLYDIARKRSEVFSIDSSKSAMDLVRAIVSRNGKRFQDFVYDSDGKIQSGLAFAVNGVSVQKSALNKTKCSEISEFVILPPISGGSFPGIETGESFSIRSY
jgi:molybdopterin converting factor small subunit